MMVRLVRTSIADAHDDHGEAAVLQKFLEARARCAAGGQDRDRLAAERMDHARRIDAAAAGVSLLDRMYARSSKARRSTLMVRSIAGLTVRVTITRFHVGTSIVAVSYLPVVNL